MWFAVCPQTTFLVPGTPDVFDLPVADIQFICGYCEIKPNLDCNYTLLIGMAPNGILFWYQINRKSVVSIFFISV